MPLKSDEKDETDDDDADDNDKKGEISPKIFIVPI